MNPRSLHDLLIPRFAAFCIGSLPFRDSRSAVDFVMDRPWIVPFWPELPARAPSEKMLARAARAKEPGWDGYEQQEASALFELRERIGALDRESQEGLFPVLKCQLAGPLTIGDHLFSGRSGIAERCQAALEICLKQIEWQQQFFSPLPARLLIMVDDPELNGWNELSATDREVVRDAYSYLCVRVGELGAHFGVHTCAPFHPELAKLPAEVYSFDLVRSSIETITSDSGREALAECAETGKIVVAGGFAAVCDTDFEVEIARGNALLEEFALTAGDGVLWSANCGHAGAGESWLKQLYTEYRD